VAIARWLALCQCSLWTSQRGLTGAKAEVHQLLDELARQGIAIVMISSELPEILSMSDRIITIREGHLTGEFTREEATEEKLMQAMALEQDLITIS
jgi:ABC-type sugar transport system ATPase subunit